MTFPLSSSMEFTVAVDLAVAFVLGIGFGFALERAGFGSARKLTAVFYLYDMAVTKVMFTAVVTTMGTIAPRSFVPVSVTVTPLVGAGDVNVTVPVLGLPPVTPIGLRVSVLSVGPMSSESVVSTLSALSTDQ